MVSVSNIQHKTYNTVLTIAGSDPSGGAGMQADIKTITALGGYAAAAITAITVQNTTGVKCATPLSAELVAAQIDAVLDDLEVGAVKIGMLANAQIINAVADCLIKHRAKNIVLDPVMVSTSGLALLDNEAIDTLIERLFPLADIITPNIPEAEQLLGYKLDSGSDFAYHSQKILELYGCKAVILKGGHLNESVMRDYLSINGRTGCVLESPAIQTTNNHGTGCTLSSAIATFLAKGYDIENACKMAKEYLFNALKYGANYTIGHGNGAVNHIFNIIEPTDI